ncbi:hypothetical protein D6777_04700, partial [Candidatus Woesearchaeota archaeon]
MKKEVNFSFDYLVKKLIFNNLKKSGVLHSFLLFLILFLLLGIVYFSSMIAANNVTNFEINQTPNFSYQKYNYSELVEPYLGTNLTNYSESNMLEKVLKLILDKVHFIKGQIANIEASLKYVNDSPIPGQTINFYTYEATNSANFYFLGNRVTDMYGRATLEWNTSPFNEGSYVVNATTLDLTATTMINIEKNNGIIKNIFNVILNKVKLLRGELLIISANLTYVNQSPIPNEPVSLFIFQNDSYQIYNETSLTNNQGQTYFQYSTENLTQGTYYLNLSYNGNNITTKNDYVTA